MRSHPAFLTAVGAAPLLAAILLLIAACDRQASEPSDVTPAPDIAELHTNPIGADILANAAYPSVLLEGELLPLTDGRYEDAQRGVTLTLLTEPTAQGELAGAPIAAVLLAESGGGSGTFMSLALVTLESGRAQVLATKLLGDRPRVRRIAISADGRVTVDLIQVGANDRFCCPATPMRVDYVLRGSELLPQAITSASIDIDGYAERVVAHVVPPTAYDRSEPPAGQGEPAHFAWTFGADDNPDFARAHVAGFGYVAVYPVADYRAIWDAESDPFVTRTLARLDTLLADRPADAAAPLPILPLQNAVNDFAARIDYLELAGGGRGVRCIGRFAQDAAPLLNSQLRYLFQGLSADRRWLIVASLPVRTSALPDDNAITPIDPGAPQRDILAHLRQWRDRFEAIPGSAFEPSLDVLDALLRSVTISVSGTSP